MADNIQWMGDDEFTSRRDYLQYTFRNIEDEVFKSFDINPLREDGLKISSIFYADTCLRLYPIITIGFNLLVFGKGMKQNYEMLVKLRDDEKLQRKMDDFEQSLIELSMKKAKNEDGIRDYYKFFTTDEPYLTYYLEDEADLNFHVGKIEYDQKIQPFKKKNWGKYLDIRNSIEHRGNIEASQLLAINALGVVYLQLKKLCFTEPSRKMDSKIFGGYDIRREPVYNPLMNIFRQRFFRPY